MVPDPALVDRFRRDLDALCALGRRIGIAVSGGPDSLALLILAAAARPGLIEAASVDHDLRRDSRSEAEMVEGLCRHLGVPHVILTVHWPERPTSAVQERARAARYALLATWAKDRSLDAVATAHHADDQAETLIMRLNRGSGVRGLAAMRPVATVPGSDIALVRPLLGWTRNELGAICAAASLSPVTDPSNADEHYERVRVRAALADAQWLDRDAVGRSAAHLAAADDAISWAAEGEWARAVTPGEDLIVYTPLGAPAEIVRRIVVRAIAALAHEGNGEQLRARELDTVMAALTTGQQVTLRGVICAGGEEWRFTRASQRTADPLDRHHRRRLVRFGPAPDST